MDTVRVNPLFCKEYRKEITSLSNKNRHLRKIHKHDSRYVERRPDIMCSLSPNEYREKFPSFYDLDKHFTNIHNMKITESITNFRSYEEFEAWQGEENRHVNCACTRAVENKKADRIVYYYCNRSNYRRYQSNCVKYNVKLGGSIHIQGICPSRFSFQILTDGLTLIGNCMKIFATVPGTYYLLLISQTIVSIGQIFMLVLPSKVASYWFGAEEVSTACAIGVFGSQLGTSAGAVSTQLVKNGNYDQVKDDLNRMFIYYAILSVAVFVMVILFFRSKPSTPPSPSQASLSTLEKEKEFNFFLALKDFSKNKDFLVVLFSFGVTYGIWNTFSVMLNKLYTNSFPNEDDGDLGIMTFVTCMSGGCFGSLIFGYILDKTHKFKLVSFSVQVATLLGTIAQAIMLLSSSKLGTFIAVPTYGFFSGSLLVIGYEYTIETTYPIPESFGASVLNVIVYVFSLIFTLVFPYVFDTFGYLTGWIGMIVLTAIGAISILFVSPELKRRNANIK